jgi:iron(III) transport system substrate-binding protein
MVARADTRARMGLARSLAVAALLTVSPALAAPPTPAPVTADLVAAALKEGKVVFHTSIDLELAAKIAQSFEAKYPGLTVQVERS